MTDLATLLDDVVAAAEHRAAVTQTAEAEYHAAIDAAVAHADGTVTAVADRLGVSRSAIHQQRATFRRNRNPAKETQ